MAHTHREKKFSATSSTDFKDVEKAKKKECFEIKGKKKNHIHNLSIVYDTIYDRY